jgi:hypothetical protein
LLSVALGVGLAWSALAGGAGVTVKASAKQPQAAVNARRRVGRVGDGC